MTNQSVHFSSDSNEWYTPSWIIELARELMGGIDLDPASNDEAQQTVQAARYYSLERDGDGLALPWAGRMWVNPPYSDMVESFVTTLVERYERGDIESAVLIVAARTDTGWFQPLFRYPRCSLKGRVKFIPSAAQVERRTREGKGKGSPSFPSVIVYFGSHPERFRALFSPHGHIDMPSSALVPEAPRQTSALAPLLDKAHVYAEQASAPATRAAYRSDWLHFTAWCEAHARAALPADVATLAAYLAECADSLKLSTIERRLVSISKAHQLASAPNPAKTEHIHLVMSGIRRALGRKQTQKAPATLEPLRAMLDTLGDTPAGLRDRALLLLGFAGAFRRSELVALDIADLAFVPSGVVITLRRSKTDQEGRGTSKGIPMGLHVATCPVRALRAWIEAAELVRGALFRPIDRYGNIAPARLTAHAIAWIVKRCASAAGLEAAAFSGHSLRAGLATAAAAAGADDRSIQKQTGHKSRAMLDRYIRAAELFKDNAAGSVGL